MQNKFLFGVATSSHQIEGNNIYNNWYQWEKRNNLEPSGIACNSWEQYEEDIERVKFLGCNSYRFSIEWSRIFPKINEVDEKALNKYENIISKLKNNNIEPIITLHHFTRPSWIDTEFGGLHNPKIIPYFNFYVETILNIFNNNVKYIITFNEPILEVLNGYIIGNRPPGFKGNFNLFSTAIENICDMHSSAYDIIKKYNPEIQISIAKNLVEFEKQHTIDPIKSYLEDNTMRNYNEEIIKALTIGKINIEILPFGLKGGIKKEKEAWKNKLDYLGINHYNICYINISYFSSDNIEIKTNNPESSYFKNKLNWDISPNSMYNVLKETQKYNLPILITESGTCDNSKSSFLQKYIIKNHFNGMIHARNTLGLKIIGYCVWSLMDNFEWDDGYGPKFGLYERILKDKKIIGKIKESGKYYKNLIKENKDLI